MFVAKCVNDRMPCLPRLPPSTHFSTDEFLLFINRICLHTQLEYATVRITWLPSELRYVALNSVQFVKVNQINK